jgi:hypothetical protein
VGDLLVRVISKKQKRERKTVFQILVRVGVLLLRNGGRLVAVISKKGKKDKKSTKALHML